MVGMREGDHSNSIPIVFIVQNHKISNSANDNLFCHEELNLPQATRVVRLQLASTPGSSSSKLCCSMLDPRLNLMQLLPFFISVFHFLFLCFSFLVLLVPITTTQCIQGSAHQGISGAGNNYHLLITFHLKMLYHLADNIV